MVTSQASGTRSGASPDALYVPVKVRESCEG